MSEAVFSLSLMVVTNRNKSSQFSLISLIIVGISVINIAHTFFLIIAQRKREIGILRALGASRGQIRWMTMLEAAILGLLGGAVGVGVALLGILLTDWVSVEFIPDFPFKPDSFFVVEPVLIASALAAAILFCLIGAWLPASHAARLDPAVAFRE